ncbi:MAG: 30S ribosomal protein S15 [Endomicrobium sp.]|jgi:small subunit ribosomal protein S15|nr:30S ribosomal protein S15 [Endomicrobium sp.]
MITIEKATVEQFKMHETDTGSSEVQVALFTMRINYLSDHFKKSPKDFASKVGFLKIVGQRRRLLNYIKKRDKNSYSSLLKKLDLRK